ncbi:MAG: hypothetical protein ACLGH4_08765 [Actinomycetes bacterium]
MRSGERSRAAALREAAQARTADVDERLLDAIRYLDRKALPITVASVAREAGVSRQSIYARGDLLREIRALGNRHPSESAAVSAAARASAASLKARNTALLNENRRLKEALTRAERKIGELIAERRNGGPATSLRDRSA